MAVQHKDISDADLHEVKGAASALSGQTLQSNGDGTTSFVTYRTPIGGLLQGASEDPQICPDGGDPIILEFGSGTSNSDASLDVDGALTFINNGYYQIIVTLNLGSSDASDVPQLVYHTTVDGVSVGVPRTYTHKAGATAQTVEFDISGSYSAGQVLRVELAKTVASGSDIGGAYSYTTVSPIDGWGNVPSASIACRRIGEVQL